jgi:hypothetical protein
VEAAYEGAGDGPARDSELRPPAPRPGTLARRTGHHCRMPELSAPDATIARFLLERGIAAIYVIAFVVALRQFPALCGERGLEPAEEYLELVPRFLDGPSIFRWLGYSDRKLRAVAWVGLVVAGPLLLGIPQGAPPIGLALPVDAAIVLTTAAWLGLWVLYQSIVNIGGTFYAFGWETLLLEAGCLAAFLGPAMVAPPWLVILAFRWLAFRVEFGAGLIKLRGDPCWRNLTCMDFHHETQPMPNPLSWWFHHLPRRLHRVETVGNFVAQLVLPFGLFLPQPLGTIAGVLMILTQLYLVVSGNYAWLNWVTIVAMTAAIADPVVHAVLPGLGAAGAFTATPAWFEGLVVLLAFVIVVLSWFPVRNLLSPSQAMNRSFDPFRLVNTYGAFGSVSRVRDEVVIEGSNADSPTDSDWVEYGFKGKPGDPSRLPPQWAPYHLRLDWLMWFLPLSPRYGDRWFVPFLVKLLEGDRPTLALLRHNPFPDEPPRWIRARLFRYRFSSWAELRATGAWWVRTPSGELLRPIGLQGRD